MSSHKVIDINTIEELVHYASERRTNSNRYTLEERLVELEGRKYQKYLSETGHDWSYSVSLMLSDDLGNQIDAIWTKREAYRGSSYVKNVGSLSLQSIIKRLGETDAANGIAKKIKAAQKAEQQQAAKIKRNNARRNVKTHAQSIIDAMSSHPEIWGGKIPDAVIELSNLQDEE